MGRPSGGRGSRPALREPRDPALLRGWLTQRPARRRARRLIRHRARGRLLQAIRRQLLPRRAVTSPTSRARRAVRRSILPARAPSPSPELQREGAGAGEGRGACEAPPLPSRLPPSPRPHQPWEKMGVTLELAGAPGTLGARTLVQCPLPPPQEKRQAPPRVTALRADGAACGVQPRAKRGRVFEPQAGDGPDVQDRKGALPPLGSTGASCLPPPPPAPGALGLLPGAQVPPASC